MTFDHDQHERRWAASRIGAPADGSRRRGESEGWAREVQAREQRPQRQVQKLRIEVDEAKRAREVAEITGTEYFRNLQEQARRLRPKR